MTKKHLNELEEIKLNALAESQALTQKVESRDGIWTSDETQRRNELIAIIQDAIQKADEISGVVERDIIDESEMDVRVTFARSPQEQLVQQIAEQAEITEDEAWGKVADFYLGLLVEDIETELVDCLTNNLGLELIDSKSYFSWSTQNDLAPEYGTQSLMFKLSRTYFDQVLDRPLTNKEWQTLVEEFKQAIQHDNEVDLHFAEADDFS